MSWKKKKKKVIRELGVVNWNNSLCMLKNQRGWINFVSSFPVSTHYEETKELKLTQLPLVLVVMLVKLMKGVVLCISFIYIRGKDWRKACGAVMDLDLDLDLGREKMGGGRKEWRKLGLSFVSSRQGWRKRGGQWTWLPARLWKIIIYLLVMNGCRPPIFRRWMNVDWRVSIFHC